MSRIATHTYYRLRVDGPPVPSDGPVLLLSNHPNSLLDPALVAAAARRPVRFLAKSTLFDIPVIGWLVQGAGSIPVYRRQDDPAKMERNVEAFRAVDEAILEGHAIGVFPEGRSHDEPSIAPLRTGAARIALTAAGRLHGPFPIVPIGLVFRRKEVFRSEAMICIGPPIEWADLADSGPEPEVVRELTHRIDRALRRITINLTNWEDAPLVEAADAIYVAEFGAERTPAAHLARVRAGLRRLAELRFSGNDDWRRVVGDVLRHRRLLDKLRLDPADLAREPDLRRAAGAFPRLSLLAAIGGALGIFLFWPPYRLTALSERVFKPLPYVRSTTKILSGIVLFGVWIVLLSLVTGVVAGRVAGIGAAAILPAVAIATLRFQEGWKRARGDVRIYLLGRFKPERLSELRQRQRMVAAEVAALVDRTGMEETSEREDGLHRPSSFPD